MDCSPPGSSVHGILQARILEWVVIPFSKGSSSPRDWTLVSCTGVRFFTVWATRTYWIFCTLLGGGSDLLPEVTGYLLKNRLKNCLVILIWLDVCCSLSLFCFGCKFFFYWSIVDLQYCVSFCYTAKWISYTYIHFFRFFSHIVHYRVLSWVPCAIYIRSSFVYLSIYLSI